MPQQIFVCVSSTRAEMPERAALDLYQQLASACAHRYVGARIVCLRHTNGFTPRYEALRRATATPQASRLHDTPPMVRPRAGFLSDAEIL
jgi:hypothetical protein